MNKPTVQDLLQKFVDNNGEGVSVEEVTPFLNEVDPLNKRIAHELMHNITGDVRYLISCMAVIKDDVETLWEFLFDYTSELKDPYVITILMLEGLRYLDPIKDADKVEKIIYNWKILNPCNENLPDDEETVVKIKNILELSLPLIATIFVNWMLAGIKYKDFYEFGYFPYYLLNHAHLKFTFPENVFKTIDLFPDDHIAQFNKGILHVFQYDIEAANACFIHAAKSLLANKDVIQSYNVITLWYQSAVSALEKMPELLLDLQDAVYEIVQKGFELYPDNPEIVIMTTYLYAEIASVLHKQDKLDYDRLMSVSSRFEEQVHSYKRKFGIVYTHNLEKKAKLNIAFMSQYMSKSAINSVVFDFLKHHNKEKINVFFYDCGMNPKLSDFYRDEYSKYATIRTYEDKYKGDKIRNIVELSDMIKDDSIDIIIYTDWLYNVIGHFLCSLQPAPLIISSNLDGISTGLKSVPIMFNYLAVDSSKVSDNLEQIIDMPLLFAQLGEGQLAASREIFEIPDHSVLLYASNYLNNISDYEFVDLVSRILIENPDAHFAFSGPGNSDVIFEYLDDRGLADRATYLGDIDSADKLMSFIKMADLYLNTLQKSNISELYSVMLDSKPLVTMAGSNGEFITALDACVAHSHDDYVKIATDLINSKELRIQLGKALKERYDRDLKFTVSLKKTEDTLFRLYNDLCN